jgi:hypothetical protein
MLQLYVKRAKIFLANVNGHEVRCTLGKQEGPQDAPDWVLHAPGFREGIADKSIINLTPPKPEKQEFMPASKSEQRQNDDFMKEVDRERRQNDDFMKEVDRERRQNDDFSGARQNEAEAEKARAASARERALQEEVKQAQVDDDARKAAVAKTRTPKGSVTGLAVVK